MLTLSSNIPNGFTASGDAVGFFVLKIFVK